MRGCGGKKTAPEYKNNTYDLAGLLHEEEEEDCDTWKIVSPLPFRS